ncbi:DUF1564 family protein [Leptospira stimsonii]|uniref:DUF1564 family protein n=1 Tax=Leptospira stimsonii TaxID=2202203 RepID=A0ABY2MZY8_9LEPT|nr:DUF1564 family protein [Leptospira stimsonii]TGK19110.1 DUF1564 family protein [Leptospira stimsonii]TGM13068.1 DUF1564 family protein [Leptospira stimsonii]
MRTKKEKQPVRHLRLLKPHRLSKDLSNEKDFIVSKSGGVTKKIGSPSDLNVPEELIPYLEKRIQKAGSLRILLNQCLRKKTFLGLIQFHFPRKKIGYQKQKLQLVRFSFRPFEDDWIELKRLSFFHGISMCRMFVKLLEMESFPPNSNRLRLPEFVREKNPSPAIPLITTDKDSKPENLSILEEGEFIQIAS